MLRQITLALAGLLAAAAVPTPASATSVVMDGSNLYVTGQAGENNFTRIAEDTAARRVDIFASGTVITGPPCTDHGGGSVTCPFPAAPIKLVFLGGDGDDTLTLSVKPNGAFAGAIDRPLIAGDAGNDTLTVQDGPALTLSGNAGDDQLDAGPGADYLSDGPGSDRLIGGDGDDSVALGGDPSDVVDRTADADTVSGGAGSDRLLLSAPQGMGVTANLDGRANDGIPGERDNIGNDFEWIQGTSGDDTFTTYGRAPRTGVEFHALDGNDRLTGASGDDKLAGDGGDDTITPGTGADSVWGGPGNDRINTRDASTNPPAATRASYLDKIACDDGTDSVELDSIDFTSLGSAPDCETVKRPADVPLVTVGGSKRGITVKGRTVTFRSASCAKDARENCRGVFRVVMRGEEIAAGRFDLRPGSARPVKLKLRSAGKKHLSEGSIKVKARAETPGRVEKLGTYRLKR